MVLASLLKLRVTVLRAAGKRANCLLINRRQASCSFWSTGDIFTTRCATAFRKELTALMAVEFEQVEPNLC